MPEPTPTIPPRRRRLWRWVIGVVAVLVLVPAIGIGALLLTLDTDALKPRIAAAVEQATGRRLTLAGRIAIRPALVPTIAIEDIALANMAGGSAPEMLQARRVELQLALLPLISRQIDVRRLVVVEPRLLLETDAQGRPNWAFAPQAAAAPAAPEAATPAPVAAAAQEAGARAGITVGAVSLAGGVLTWRDGQAGVARVLTIEQLDASSGSGGMRFSGRLALDGQAFRLEGESGLVAGLTAADTPWPARITLDGEGARLSIDASIARPATMRGWHAVAEGRLDALARLVPFAPQLATLPPLRGITFRAEARQNEAGRPSLESLTLGLGESDLAPLRPGLVLQRLALTAPGPREPLQVDLTATLGGAPLAAQGTAGTLEALMAGPPASLPVDLTLRAANAEAKLTGTLGTMPPFDGTDVALDLRAPDTAPLAALVGARLPALRDLTMTARLAATAPRSVTLRDLRIASSAGDLAGEVTLTTGGGRPSISGQVTSQRLDLTALAPPAAAAPAAPAPAPAPAAPPAPAPAPAQAGPRRVIPQAPVALDGLRAADADLRFTLAQLVAQPNLTLRDVSGRLVLADGHATLDPFAATVPGGGFDATARADATADPPSLQMTLRTRDAGIDIGPLQEMLGKRYGAGRIEADLALAGQGRDTRAIAATLAGQVGLAVVDGRIDRSLLAAIPRELLSLIAPQGIPADGLALRCFALQAPVQNGVLRADTFLADTPIGQVGGGGTINFGNEQIGLRLLPDVRAGGVRIRAPVGVSGTLAAPRVAEVSPAAAAAVGLGAFLGHQHTPDRTLQGLAEALGGGSGAPALPDCATALTAARGGRQGAVPTTPAAPVPPQPADPAAPERPRVPQPADLLRGLFGGGRR
ncbi:MAG TPA: AsmA family protein [Roseomonas sp.]|jgi:AsmA protein